MSSTDPQTRAERHGEARTEAAPGKLDREISLRGLTIFTVVLALIMVAAAALMWGLSDYLTSSIEARDPAPPVLPAARQQWQPPEPRLQNSPEREMRELRAEEEELLGSYGWVDETGGVARVPLERALDLVAEYGLPATGPPSAPPPGQGPDAGDTGDAAAPAATEERADG